jgi:hypothetical protein
VKWPHGGCGLKHCRLIDPRTNNSKRLRSRGRHDNRSRCLDPPGFASDADQAITAPTGLPNGAQLIHGSAPSPYTTKSGRRGPSERVNCASGVRSWRKIS